MSLISIFLVFCDNVCILTEKFNLHSLIINLIFRPFLPSYFVLFALCLNNFIFSFLASLCCACAVDLFVCFLRFLFCIIKWPRGYKHPNVLCVFSAGSPFTHSCSFSHSHPHAALGLFIFSPSIRFFLPLSGQEVDSNLLSFICIYIFYCTCFWALLQI